MKFDKAKKARAMSTSSKDDVGSSSTKQLWSRISRKSCDGNNTNEGKINKKTLKGLHKKIFAGIIRRNSILTNSDGQEEYPSTTRRSSLSEFITRRSSSLLENPNRNAKAEYLVNKLEQLREKTKSAVKKSWAEVESIQVEKSDLQNRCEELELELENLRDKFEIEKEKRRILELQQEAGCHPLGLEAVEKEYNDQILQLESQRDIAVENLEAKVDDREKAIELMEAAHGESQRFMYNLRDRLERSTSSNEMQAETKAVIENLRIQVDSLKQHIQKMDQDSAEQKSKFKKEIESRDRQIEVLKCFLEKYKDNMILSMDQVLLSNGTLPNEYFSTNIENSP